MDFIDLENNKIREYQEWKPTQVANRRASQLERERRVGNSFLLELLIFNHKIVTSF